MGVLKVQVPPGSGNWVPISGTSAPGGGTMESAAVLYSANIIDAFEGCRVYRSTAGECILRVALKTNVSASAGAVLIAAPAGYLPSGQFRVVAWLQSGGPAQFVPLTIVAGTGNVYCEASLVANAVVVGTFVYPRA